jgi:DNA polymerase-3 subunit gamma/tau
VSVWQGLQGQERAVAQLRRSIERGRVPHASLFSGPAGAPLLDGAIAFAMALSCQRAPGEGCDGDPEAMCGACAKIASGIHPDIVTLVREGAAQIVPIESVRNQVIARVGFPPHEGAVRVFIIEEATAMAPPAANALLKTLEEPPAHVLFILATTEFHKVPATIVSRCQRFVFTRHGVREISEHLLRVAEAEGVTIEAAAAEAIARSATGAMRDALSVLDQLMAGSDGTVTLEHVRMLLGTTESGEVVRLVTALADADLQAALELINAVADGGADLRQFARDLVDRLRSLMLLAATGDTSTLELPDATIRELEAIAARVELGQLVRWLKVFANLDYQLKNSPYGQLPLELATVELLAVPAAAPPVTTPATTRPAGPSRQRPVVPQPEAPPPAVLTQQSPAEVQASTPAVAQAPATVIEVEDNAAFLLEEVEAVWPQFVEDIRSESRLIYAQLDGVKPINIEEQTLVLLASKGAWQRSMLEQERTRRLLERVLSKLLKNAVHIRATADEQEEMPDARKHIQHARRDPRVRKAMNIFEAEIVGLDTPEISSQ